MRDEWKRKVLQKTLVFAVPGIIIMVLVILSGSRLAVPFFLPAVAILIAFPLAELIGHFFPSIFHSGQWRKRPQPTLSFVRGLKNQKQFEAAMDELKRMAETDSQEVDIWLEMIEIAMIDLKDPDWGERVFRQAYSMLESEQKRCLVQRFYSNLTVPGKQLES